MWRDVSLAKSSYSSIDLTCTISFTVPKTPIDRLLVIDSNFTFYA